MIPAKYRDVRLALLWGIVMGIGFVVGVPRFQPEQVGFASDVYYLGAEAFLAGANPYEIVSPAGSGYIYPPITLFAFVPHALTGSTLGAYLLQTTLNVLTAAALAYLLCRYLEAHGPDLARIDRALLVGFVLLSVHTTTVYVMAQVNLQLALAIAGGGILVERGRSKLGGAAFAAAAAVKLFPAAAGLWLLRLRQWRAVAAAILTGLSLTIAGVLLVPREAVVTYFTEVLPAESKSAEFAGGLPSDAMYVTIRRPIAELLPEVDPAWYLVLGVLVLSPFVLASYRDVDARIGRLTALLATMLGTLLLFPFEAYFFSLLYFPLVPLLYMLEAGRVRRLLAAGTVLLSTTISYEPLRVWLDALPFPAGLETSVLAAARAVLGFAQPALIGGLLVLAACALWHHESMTEPVASS